MDKRIVYTLDGKLHIVVPVFSCGLSLEEIAEKDVPAGVEWHIIDIADLPESREHRDAWYFDPTTKKCCIDTEKAKKIDEKRKTDAEEIAAFKEWRKFKGS